MVKILHPKYWPIPICFAIHYAIFAPILSLINKKINYYISSLITPSPLSPLSLCDRWIAVIPSIVMFLFLFVIYCYFLFRIILSLFFLHQIRHHPDFLILFNLIAELFWFWRVICLILFSIWPEWLLLKMLEQTVP